MTKHRMVPVKVNAWVDEGIADLVSALSQFDGLVTLESCQGDADDHRAFVIFEYGDWRSIGELLYDKLLPALAPDLRSDVSLDLRHYDTETAQGSISINPCAIPRVVEALRGLLPVSRGVAMTGHAHRQTIPKIISAASGN